MVKVYFVRRSSGPFSFSLALQAFTTLQNFFLVNSREREKNQVIEKLLTAFVTSSTVHKISYGMRYDGVMIAKKYQYVLL